MAKDQTGKPMDFPDGGLGGSDDGANDQAKGLTTDGIQTIGSVGSIPSYQSPGQIRKGGSFEGTKFEY